MAAQKIQSLSIPKRHKSAMLQLIGLSESAVRVFVGSLKKSSPAASLFDLSVQISKANSELDFDEIHGILSMLASLYRVRIETGMAVTKLVRDFIAAAKEEVKRFPDSAKYDWEMLREKLLEVFKADQSLGITAKASELRAENPRLFCPANARILSDIRPIFSADATENPRAAIIQHTLKIAYHEEDSETKEFYVNLDIDDIGCLLGLLKRALEKERNLRKLIKQSGLVVLAS